MTEVARDSSIKVRLVVTSADVLPQAISDDLGIAPSKTWLKGETVTPRAKNTHQEHGWVLSVQGQSNELFAERLIDQLVAAFPTGKLAALSHKYGSSIEIEISVIASFYATGSAPSISLSPAHVAFLAECSGSFDVDLYVG
ncbi:MAG: DUF4279 domain-containing protein [Gammaproteobacteria bacterium]